MSKVFIDGSSLTIEDAINVVRNGFEVELTEDAIKSIKRSRQIVDDFVDEKRVVYGITTGFGKFSDISISKDETKDLQRNLIISHSCGVGNPFDVETTKMIMLLRANALSKGFSGIRLETLSTLINMINKVFYIVSIKVFT